MLAIVLASRPEKFAISSTVFHTGTPRFAAYTTSKGAVIGLTRCLAADVVQHGIRVNAICPGTVETPSLEERINVNADPVAARAAFIARQPPHVCVNEVVISPTHNRGYLRLMQGRQQPS